MDFGPSSSVHRSLLGSRPRGFASRHPRQSHRKAQLRAATDYRRGRITGAEDKASNKIDDLGGKAKEGLGKVTGDKSTENEGKLDQAKSSLEDAGEKVKDAFKN